MAILSIDFGQKRIGLALSRAGFLVSRFKTLENNERIFENLREISPFVFSIKVISVS